MSEKSAGRDLKFHPSASTLQPHCPSHQPKNIRFVWSVLTQSKFFFYSFHDPKIESTRVRSDSARKISFLNLVSGGDYGERVMSSLCESALRYTVFIYPRSLKLLRHISHKTRMFAEYKGNFVFPSRKICINKSDCKLGRLKTVVNIARCRLVILNPRKQPVDN